MKISRRNTEVGVVPLKSKASPASFEGQNYQEFVSINPELLDREVLTHAEKMVAVGEALANAEAQVSYYKDKLDLTKAQVDERIRKNPGDFGLSKITEASINSEVLKDEKYMAVQAKLRYYQHEYQLLRGMDVAMRHRKDMLELHVSLTLSGWSGDPKLPQMDREALAGHKNQRVAQKEATHRRRKGGGNDD